jgi:hypothetical protein
LHLSTLQFLKGCGKCTSPISGWHEVKFLLQPGDLGVALRQFGLDPVEEDVAPVGIWNNLTPAVAAF